MSKVKISKEDREKILRVACDFDRAVWKHCSYFETIDRKKIPVDIEAIFAEWERLAEEISRIARWAGYMGYTLEEVLWREEEIKERLSRYRGQLKGDSRERAKRRLRERQ